MNFIYRRNAVIVGFIGVISAIALTKTPLTAAASNPPQELDIDIKQIDQILNAKGKVNDDAIKLARALRSALDATSMAKPKS